MLFGVLAGPSALTRLLASDEGQPAVQAARGEAGPPAIDASPSPAQIAAVGDQDQQDKTVARVAEGLLTDVETGARGPAADTQRFAGPLDLSLERLAAHIETHVGPIGATASGPADMMAADIDLLLVAPEPHRPYWYVVTAGLSDTPMQVAGRVAPAPYAELALALPANWAEPQPDGSLDPQADPAPLLALLEIADLPARTGEGLAYGDAFPVSAAAGGERDVAAYALSWPMAPGEPGFMRFVGGHGEPVQIWGVYPLSTAELTLRQQGGMTGLEALFDAAGRVELHGAVRRPAFAAGRTGPGAFAADIVKGP